MAEGKEGGQYTNNTTALRLGVDKNSPCWISTDSHYLERPFFKNVRFSAMIQLHMGPVCHATAGS